MMVDKDKKLCIINLDWSADIKFPVWFGKAELGRKEELPGWHRPKERKGILVPDTKDRRRCNE